MRINEFYVTFLERVGTTEIHPISKKIHKDGYIVVEAFDRDQARKLTYHVFPRGVVSNIFSEEQWKDNPYRDTTYQLGEIGRIQSDGVLTIWGEKI